MTFTVTYRNTNGHLVAEPFEAESRNILFKILAERGISAVRVNDGASRKYKVDAPVLKISIAVLGVVITVATLVLVLPRNYDPKCIPEQKKKAVSIEAVNKIILPVAPAETNACAMVVLPNGIITNKPKTIAEAIAMVRLKPGFHSYKDVDEVFAKTNLFQVGPYKTLNLKSSTEALLSLVATRSRTLPIPPMPPMPQHMEKDFEIAMNNYLTAMEGDSDADIAQKKKIEMLKDMMDHYVTKEGMTPSQALYEIQKEHNRAANLYQLYRGEYVKLVRQDSQDADAFYEAAIGKLKENGAPIFDREANHIEE